MTGFKPDGGEQLIEDAAEDQLNRFLRTEPGSRVLCQVGGWPNLARKHLENLEKWPFSRERMRSVIEGASGEKNQKHYLSALDQMELEGQE